MSITWKTTPFLRRMQPIQNTKIFLSPGILISPTTGPLEGSESSFSRQNNSALADVSQNQSSLPHGTLISEHLNYHRGDEIGGIVAGVLIFFLLLAAGVGLFCCRNQSPCRSLVKKIKGAKQNFAQKRQKRFDILTVLGYSPFVLNRTISNTGAKTLKNELTRGHLMTVDTYDGLTSVERVRNANALESSTNESIISSQSGTTSSAYSLSEISNSMSIDKCTRRSCNAINTYYRPSFHPVYNQPLSYLCHNTSFSLKGRSSDSGTISSISTRNYKHIENKRDRRFSQNSRHLPVIAVPCSSADIRRVTSDKLGKQNSTHKGDLSDSNSYKTIHSY